MIEMNICFGSSFIIMNFFIKSSPVLQFDVNGKYRFLFSRILTIARL